MLFSSRASGLLLCSAVLLAACSRGEVLAPPAAEQESASSAWEEPVTESFEGMLTQAGISIYMEGTHRLDTGATGDTVLLQSVTVDLDAYIGSTVRVTGIARPTIEAGGVIVEVTDIEQLASPLLLEPTQEQISSSSASSVVDANTARGVQSSSVAAVAAPRSSAAASFGIAVSSASAVFFSSSSLPLQTASSSVGSAAPDARVASAMAKAAVNASTFTQNFCTRHVGFCVPLHKSWYYNSFGATSSSLWHVEVSSEEVTGLGTGPLVINLVSGSVPGPDGGVVESDGMVTGYRSWTGGRYFQVTAPAALRTAVSYIVENFTVYQPESPGPSSAATSSASSL